jgi:periplasmic protein TonB
MFDKLVESTPHAKTKKRTGVFLLSTTLIYGIAVLVLAVMTIFWFSPELIGGLNVKAMIDPPEPPRAEEPAPEQIINRDVQDASNLQTPKIVTDIPEPTKVPPRRMFSNSKVVPGGEPGSPGGVPDPGREEVPPPPPPAPASPPTPTPTPKPILKVSGGVLPGLALVKITPTYPPIARKAGVSGAVMIQVLISEQGRVISAEVQSGHLLLNDAALQAAKRWIFKPTELSGVPVKVQGVLKFNFVL